MPRSTHARVDLVSGRCRISVGADTSAGFRRLELSERQVLFLLGHRVRVDPKGERRVRVPELVRDPPHALACLEFERDLCVTGAVQLQGAGQDRFPTCLGFATALARVLEDLG